MKIDVGITNVSWDQTVRQNMSGACLPSACAERPDGRKVN